VTQPDKRQIEGLPPTTRKLWTHETHREDAIPPGAGGDGAPTNAL